MPPQRQNKHQADQTKIWRKLQLPTALHKPTLCICETSPSICVGCHWLLVVVADSIFNIIPHANGCSGFVTLSSYLTCILWTETCIHNKNSKWRSHNIYHSAVIIICIYFFFNSTCRSICKQLNQIKASSTVVCHLYCNNKYLDIVDNSSSQFLHEAFIFCPAIIWKWAKGNINNK